MAAMTDHWGRPAVPCKWCGTPTAMTGTRMCDGCWELETRVRRDPDLAARMLAELGTDRVKEDQKCSS